jgi:hypothetical protein
MQWSCVRQRAQAAAFRSGAIHGSPNSRSHAAGGPAREIAARIRDGLLEPHQQVTEIARVRHPAGGVLAAVGA